MTSISQNQTLQLKRIGNEKDLAKAIEEMVPVRVRLESEEFIALPVESPNSAELRLIEPEGRVMWSYKTPVKAVTYNNGRVIMNPLRLRTATIREGDSDFKVLRSKLYDAGMWRDS